METELQTVHAVPRAGFTQIGLELKRGIYAE